jgi:folate-dependent phosphoribosylglycinamide formyltransferase PurN
VPREEVRVKLHKDARRPLKILVLLSGEGRELNEILSYVDNEMIEGEILAVISDNPTARGLSTASERGIRTLRIDPTGFVDAQAFTSEINHILDRLSPDVVVLDGFAVAVRLKHRKNRGVVDRAGALLDIAATD